MTTEQTFRLAFSILFNGPILALAIVWFGVTGLSYRRYRDGRSVRSFIIAAMLLTAVAAMWASALGIIFANMDQIEGLNRIVISIERPILAAGLLSIVTLWAREERRYRRILKAQKAAAAHLAAQHAAGTPPPPDGS